MYYIYQYVFIQFTAYGVSLEELNVLRAGIKNISRKYFQVGAILDCELHARTRVFKFSVCSFYVVLFFCFYGIW